MGDPVREPVRVHERLRSQDRFFLDQEVPGSTMNVGALVTIEGDRHDDLTNDLRELFASRIHRMPRLRQRLMDVPLPGAAPVWVDDHRFDLTARIRTLDVGKPPGRSELLNLAGHLVAQPLDRAQPLWDVAVIPRTASSDSAVILRWHHALIDGMSGVEIGKLLLTTAPTMLRDPPQPWEPELPPDSSQLLAEALALQADDAFRHPAGRALTWADRDTKSLSRSDLAEGLATFKTLGKIPPNPFRPAAPGARRYAAAEVPDAVLRAISRRFDVSLEASVLAVTAGAASRLVQARGSAMDAFRVFVPRTVAYRSRSLTLGNHATFNVLDLPAGPMRESERVVEVAARLATVRQSHQAEAVSAIADLIASTARMPSTLNQSVAQWFGQQNFVHAVVSYMRGPRRSLFLAGRAHRSTCPILPRSDGVGLLFGVLSMGGTTTFGLVADPAAVPELDFLVTSVRRISSDLAGSDDT
jgi:diacylglycerol O-acyltransferase / wax synthase